MVKRGVTSPVAARQRSSYVVLNILVRYIGVSFPPRILGPISYVNFRFDGAHGQFIHPVLNIPASLKVSSGSTLSIFSMARLRFLFAAAFIRRLLWRAAWRREWFRVSTRSVRDIVDSSGTGLYNVHRGMQDALIALTCVMARRPRYIVNPPSEGSSDDDSDGFEGFFSSDGAP